MSNPSASLGDVTWVSVAGAAGVARAAAGSATSAASLSAVVERATKRDIVLPSGQRPGQRTRGRAHVPPGAPVWRRDEVNYPRPVAMPAMTRSLLALLTLCARAAAQTSAAGDTGPPNLYAAAGAGMLSPAARRAVPLVYVPNSKDGSVTVIDQRTYTVGRTLPTGAVPQHVVPSYDLKTLWVANNLGNSLTPIDPTTGRAGKSVAVDDPYNLYFTPGGRFAIVVAE